MPITNIPSYLPTMQEFMQHWTDVNATLGTKPLLLTGGVSLANFTSTKTAVQSNMTAVTQAENVVTAKRKILSDQKNALSKKLELFRKAVLGEMADSVAVARLPILPHFKSTQARFIKPLETAALIWTDINATPPSGFTPPLVLADGTALADFQTAVTALYAAYSAVTTAEVKAGNALSQRDGVLKLAKGYMRQYRIVVYARVQPGDALLTRVPRLSPVRGATPKGVTHILAFYDNIENGVRMTFDPSTSANIREYQLFFSPGPKWNPTSVELVDTNFNIAPFEFNFKLTQVAVGVTALFKVVARNDTDNTRASKVIKVKRTAEGAGALRLAA